jgi:hypothetical protein
MKKPLSVLALLSSVCCLISGISYAGITQDCMEKSDSFITQADCIQKTIKSYPQAKDDLALQRYLQKTKILEKKVKSKSLSEDEARLELLDYLNEIHREQAAAAQQNLQMQEERDTDYNQFVQSLPQPVLQPVPQAQPIQKQTNCTGVVMPGGIINTTCQ